MGLYTVLQPCVVNNLHYAQVPAAPIEVDDVVAAPLVTSGDLAPVEVVETPTAKAHRRRTDKED